jgi:hypothetical protein
MSYIVLQDCTLWILVDDIWDKRLFLTGEIINNQVQDAELAVQLGYISINN